MTNSVAIVTGASQGIGRSTGVTVEVANDKFPRDAGIARYGKPEEIAELIAFLVSPGARWRTLCTSAAHSRIY
jgi:NAD(P)-dependent dehydrogenase (short-subunit alcohol dehydrogenase family)